MLFPAVTEPEVNHTTHTTRMASLDNVDAELDFLHSVFSTWCQTNGSQGAVGECATWLASSELAPHGYQSLAHSHGVSRESWFRTAIMDLFYAYLAARLANGPLGLSGLLAVGILTRALRLDGRSLAAYRAGDLGNAVVMELTSAIEAGWVSAEDDAYLFEIQAAFDLSFDECVRLARPALGQAVAQTGDSVDTLSAHNADARAHVTALQTLHWLSEGPHWSLGVLR
jgi:hypothetical protein